MLVSDQPRRPNSAPNGTGGSAPSGDHPGVCQNCARDDEDLAAVTRLYVVPETWDQPGSVTPASDAELWCFSCRTQYPHEDIEPEPS